MTPEDLVELIPEASLDDAGYPIIPALDHGYVKLLDVMGSDEDIAYAARISTRGKKSKRSDAQLLDYLMRHEHMSPFEMAELKFEVKAPIFVARQWFRHRTGNYNEVSARYTVLPNENYIPDRFRAQDTINRQGSLDSDMDHEALRGVYENALEVAEETYEDLIEQGVARELARAILPVARYTVFIYKSDLRNLLHFLKLRLDSHAQPEIRAYASAIEAFVSELFPITWDTWRRNVKNARTFSSLELAALREALDEKLAQRIVQALAKKIEDAGLSKSIIREFRDKVGL